MVFNLGDLASGQTAQRGVRAWWILIPLGVATWALVHASGIHATVAGVLLGFMVPVIATARARVQTGTDAAGKPLYDGLAAHFAERDNASIPTAPLPA